MHLRFREIYYKIYLRFRRYITRWILFIGFVIEMNYYFERDLLSNTIVTYFGFVTILIELCKRALKIKILQRQSTKYRNQLNNISTIIIVFTSFIPIYWFCNFFPIRIAGVSSIKLEDYFIVTIFIKSIDWRLVKGKSRGNEKKLGRKYRTKVSVENVEENRSSMKSRRARREGGKSHESWIVSSREICEIDVKKKSMDGPSFGLFRSLSRDKRKKKWTHPR